MAYDKCNGRCNGRILHFLAMHTNRIDQWVFMPDDKSIIGGHNKSVVCEYDWIANTDIPKFRFFGEFEHLNKRTLYIMYEAVFFSSTLMVQAVNQNEYIKVLKKENDHLRSKFTSRDLQSVDQEFGNDKNDDGESSDEYASPKSSFGRVSARKRGSNMHQSIYG